jgi:phosphoglycolate phosphatase
VLFDLDGTLSESEPGIVGSMRSALASLGLPIPDDAALRSAIGPPFASGLPEIGIAAEHVADFTLAYRAIYEVTGLYETRLYEGIVDALEALVELGCTLCVATSKPETSARRVIEHLGLTATFKVIGCASDDYERHTKADVIAHVLDELGHVAGPEVLMVGDRRYDVEGAAAHGIDALGVAWGYGSVDELRLAGAHSIAHLPADVVAHVAGARG